MKLFLTHARIAIILFCGVLAGLMVKPVAAADEGYKMADHSLNDALANGDKKAVASLLNDNFQWVEWNGKVHTKAQVLEDLVPLAANNEGALDVRTTDI